MSRFYHRWGLLLVAACAAAAARAQHGPDFAEPAPEHELLQRFVGEWVVQSECVMEPGAAPVESRGTVSSQPLGERWVVNRMRMHDGPTKVTGLQTIGYDSNKSKYVGTWVDTMLDHLWVYEGDYDEASQTLTLNTTGPNLMGGGETTLYRDSYRFVDGDHIESRSEAQGEGGEWVTFMTGQMRRAAE
ncbi:DUF1579 domain-containing protein [Botrimarina sp.]|uniref:DUF1579 domain-containing protein n=1 Tax=Botrimarina sp. TaxID=2795802 RepID=UPI0032EEFBC3